MSDFNITQFLHPQPNFDPATEDVPGPCLPNPCGEAVCFVTGDGYFSCRCENSLEEPNEEGVCREATARAREGIHAEGGIINHTDIHRIFDFARTNTNKKQAAISEGDARLGLKISLPVTGVTILLVIAVAALVSSRLLGKKRRRQNSRFRRVTGMTHEGDNTHQMEVMVDNVNYHTCEMFDLRLQDKVFESEKLKVNELIGQGTFGQVFKGELKHGDDVKTVAVKIRVGSDEASQADFLREASLTSSFDHKNILKLIGVVTDDSGNPPYIVFEYMAQGDLATYLRKGDPTMRKHDEEYKPIDVHQLVWFAWQAAEGMDYLSSLHFVHRDLAARNILIGEDFSVKISDFGMSRDIYSTDYYKVSGSKLLPVRWMSIESLKYGKFTCESDIWSFGVVLWEIYSTGKQPYFGYTNEQVIQMLNDGILLIRPPSCSSTIYHLMLACWKLDPRKRISFTEMRRILFTCWYHRSSLAATDSDIV